LLWIHKFKDTGSISDSPHGAPSNVCTEEDVCRASVSFQHCPICSFQQHSHILGTSRSMGWNLQDIRLHPHKAQTNQKLLPH